MSVPAISVPPAALLVWSLLLFLLEGGQAEALLLAVAAHELGHLSAMRLLRLRVQSLRLEPWGLEIEYSGELTAVKKLLTAAAGPAAGLLLSLVLCSSNALCSGISLLLSLFNMLPLPPLDGGIICTCLLDICLGEHISRVIMRCLAALCCTLLIAAGLWAHSRGFGLGLLFTGAVLAVKSKFTM